jgi:hypothetical protein
VLLEARAVMECEYHGWMLDRADPHARERAFYLASQDRRPESRRRRRPSQLSVADAGRTRTGRIKAGGGNLVWSDERDRETEPAPSMRP